MLRFTVLGTLLCSSLVDARLAPVNTPEALKQCKSQPNCINPAVAINPTFHPTIKAPASKVSVRLAVQSNQPLTFPVKADKATSDGKGTVQFREYLNSEEKNKIICDGTDVRYTVSVDGGQIFVDATSTSGKLCKESSPEQFSACEYTLPDAVSNPEWDIWTLSISSSDTDQGASITLEDAYVVYDAPDLTTTMTPDNSSINVTDNFNTTTGGPENRDSSTTAEVVFGAKTFYAVAGGGALFFVLFVIVLVVAIYACIQLNKERSRKKEGPRKKDGLDDRSKPIPLDGNGILPEIAVIESKSKRMVDEKQLEAAETAQNPAPGEAPTELKSQVTNKGPDGTSTQPAADPASNV